MGRLRLLGTFLAGFLLLAPWILSPPGHAFWFDEVFTANLVTFRTSLQTVLERVGKEDAHPPGFYLLAWTYALSLIHI